MLVETLVSELAVEALDECILRWLAGLNEVNSNVVLIGPRVESAPDELWPCCEAARIAAGHGNLLKDPNDSRARK